jgi:AcrR family transcriptional regulator
MRRPKAEALKTREAVLHAAARVIAGHGAGAFTIDAVAQEAGVTKGGVLHHFPSKAALLDGLIDQVIEAFQRHLLAELAAEPDGAPGRWLRAYVRTAFFAEFEDSRLLPALAAITATDPDIAARIRSSFAESQRAVVEDGLDPAQATTIRLAVDGLMFTRAFGMDVLDANLRQQARDALIERTRQAAPL